MRRNTLSNRITLVFIFSIVLLGLFFFVLVKFQTEKDLENMKHRQLQSINYILILYKNNLSPRGMNEYFNNFDLKPVKNNNLKFSVINSGVVIFQRTTEVGRFSSLRYNGKYYLFIDNFVLSTLLESTYKRKSNNLLWLVFGVALILLISIYVSILRSIAPLKELSGEIKKFAAGDMDIDCKSDKDDEIAEVANEFDKAASKLKDLISSRQLFLRAIMHELKTPIGKGRIVSEMIGDEKAKNRLVSIFERLDLLINEFGKIEQIVSKNYTLLVQEYSLVNVVEHAADLLMLDMEKRALHVKIDIESDICIQVDFESFALALKNLMDNAIKYSTDKKVEISVKNNKLYIENSGLEKLVDIKEYEKPFVSGKSELKPGMGLGLYIAKNIVKLNDLILDYKYEKNKHQFIIDMDK